MPLHGVGLADQSRGGWFESLEFQDGSRILQVQLVVFQIDCGSKGFQVGTVEQQPRVPSTTCDTK